MSDFNQEDVYHVDHLIAEAMEVDGTIALPGVESARNKIAREVGMEEAEEGAITWDRINETDYNLNSYHPRSRYGVPDDSQ